MRIATYNVEWFNNLFDHRDRLMDDDGWSARHDITRHQQIEALGIVFTALDADAVLVVEAPDDNGKRSTVRALEGFAAAFDLRVRKAVIGFANTTQQEIALLYDPDRLTATHDPQDGGGVPRFDTDFRWDLDVDATSEIVHFSKPPLELAITTAAGAPFRLIGAHVKSKAPHGARTAHQIMRVSIENRRTQLAQCIWLRARIADHLACGDALMVMGDLNDGPGLDEYEKLFGRSGVEIVMGEGDGLRLFDPHADMAIRQRLGVHPTSSRFYIANQHRYMQALLDYIFVSDDLKARTPSWRIWHPFDDPGCYRVPDLREALLTASDHFPVSLDIDL